MPGHRRDRLHAPSETQRVSIRRLVAQLVALVLACCAWGAGAVPSAWVDAVTSVPGLEAVAVADAATAPSTTHAANPRIHAPAWRTALGGRVAVLDVSDLAY
jgi:hypothetical protein